MSLTLATDTWQSETLTADELWGVRWGSVRVHSLNDSTPTDEDGFDIPEGESIRFSAGQTIHFRRTPAYSHKNTAAGFARVELSV